MTSGFTDEIGPSWLVSDSMISSAGEGDVAATASPDGNGSDATAGWAGASTVDSASCTNSVIPGGSAVEVVNGS